MIQSIAGIMQKSAKSFGLGSLWIVAIAVAVCSTSCSHGGMLVPIPSEDSEILTTVYRNDTLQVSKDDVSIRVCGSWLDLNLTTSFRLEVNNRRDQPAIIDFGKAQLTGNQGESAALGAVYNSESEQLISNDKRAARLPAGTHQTFELSFSFGPQTTPRPPDGKKTVVELKIPFKSGEGGAHITQLGFRFRYAKKPLPWSR